MKSVLRSRALAAVLALGLLASACGSDPTEVVVGVADDHTAGLDDITLEEPVAEDSPPLLETTTTTAPRPSTTTTAPPATTLIGAPPTTEVLGPAMIGVGEWAVLRDGDGADSECSNTGLLAYLVDGVPEHVYAELGGLGGIRLFNGTRGQDAFVINCEESVERVLIQGSAIMPDQGWPELVDINLGNAANAIWFDYAADFGWRGDVFSAFGTAASGPPNGPELYVLDPVEASPELLIPRVGKRVTLADVRVDVLLPSSWELRDRSTVHHATSFSHVQIELHHDPIGEPLTEGDDFLSSDSVDVRLYMRSADDETTTSQRLTVTEWTFLAPDGVRVVRHVPVGDATVVIELFADSGDGAVDQDLPWLILDTLRIFEN